MAVSGNSSWKSEKLEDICAQITDGKHGDCQDERNSGFYFLSCKDVSSGKLNYEGARQITKVDFLDTHRRTKFEPSDVLITNSGTIGRMALAPNNKLTHRTTFQKSVAILKPIASRVAPNFLYYALQSDIHRLIEFAGGTAQKNLLLRDLRAFEIRVPPLPTQRRIAGILSAYDELIENNQRRIRILEDMARSLYREWFVHFRYPGHESVPQVDSSLGQIPQGWEVKKLGELVSVDKGVSYNGAGLTEDGNPMVNLKNILPGGGFRRDATKPYSGDFKPRHTVKPGDIILANTDLTQVGNVVASAALVPRFADERPILISHHLFAVRFVQNVPATFIYHLMLEDGFRGFAKGFAIGTTVLGLPKEGVLNFTFAYPSEELVATFAKHVAPIHQHIETLLEQAENLRRTRDLLLPRLLSGQIEVEAA